MPKARKTTNRANKRTKAADGIRPPALPATLATRRQELIGVDEDGYMSLWDVGDVQPITAFESDTDYPWMIEGGHYVIQWKGHAITVCLSNTLGDGIDVRFMCSAAGSLRMHRAEVEAMLLGKVIPDPVHSAEISKKFKRIMESMRAQNQAPHKQRGRI
jgi:hypothetical protein